MVAGFRHPNTAFDIALCSYQPITLLTLKEGDRKQCPKGVDMVRGEGGLLEARGEGGLLEARLEPPLEVRVELVPSQSSCSWGLEGAAWSSWRGLEGAAGSSWRGLEVEGGAGSSWRGLEGAAGSSWRGLEGSPGAGALRTVMEAVLREAGGAVGAAAHSELSLPAERIWKRLILACVHFVLNMSGFVLN